MQQKSKTNAGTGNTPSQKAKAPENKPNQNPPKTVKKKKKSVKKKRISFGAVFSLILFLLIAGVCAVLYFDYFGSKQILSDVLQLEQPTQEQLDELAAREAEVVAGENALTSKILENNMLADELADMQTELDAQKAEQEAKQAELEAFQEQLEEEALDLLETVQMFELMDPETAAEAIDQMTEPQARIILLTAMSSENAAAILNFMDSKITAEALDLILEDELPEVEPEPTPAT